MVPVLRMGHVYKSQGIEDVSMVDNYRYNA